MVNKYSGHKILAVEWWVKESKVILNDTDIKLVWIVQNLDLPAEISNLRPT